ncbi:E3 ubiquitin-protein ligase RZFP34-like [Lotus japonicus]|uniref:E3 ubiquitin-protein ligase RZFP34-like n=1 Tax=Lotus japonicus TaxID=34305 RepID=UPI00258A4136|nr:E3 ubiquitin-protein ligase RZFP34-like [Lotus japonicus]
MVLQQNSIELDPIDRHDIPHHDVKRVRFSKCAFTVVFAWGDTSAPNATSLMMMILTKVLKKQCITIARFALRYSCPVCSKSFCDMSRVWKKLDEEVASTPMPEMYRNKMVWILCNDCGTTPEVSFDLVAHKCLKCKSYNTRKTQGAPASRSSRIGEVVR